MKSQGPLPGVCSSHGEYGAGRSLQHANLTTNSPPKTLHGSASASLPTWRTSPPSPLRSLFKHYTLLLPLCEALSAHHAVSCLCSCCSLGREHPSSQSSPQLCSFIGILFFQPVCEREFSEASSARKSRPKIMRATTILTHIYPAPLWSKDSSCSK